MVDALCALVKTKRFLCRRGRARRGITLLELMLVLGLLVIIGAMAYPALHGPFQMQTLRKAGELVRVEWSKARIKAMKTGQIQMFSCEPESGQYQIQTYYTEQGMLESDAQSGQLGSMGGGQSSAATTSEADAYSAQTRQLPEGVVFVAVEVQADLRAMQLDQSTAAAAMPPTSSLGSNMAQQMSPVLFYPDGTTSDARLALTNQYRTRFVVISLRSLTGVVKVSELVTAEELDYVP